MLNEVRLIGNLGQDPEINQSQFGAVANLSVATTKNWKDKNEEWQSKTEWHRVVGFGFAADAAGKLCKGNQVFIAGELQTRKWQDKNGNDRWTTEVKAHVIRKLGPKDRNDNGYQGSPEPNQGDHGTGDDVPF